MIRLGALLEVLKPASPRIVNAAEDAVSSVLLERMGPLATARTGDVAFYFSKEYVGELPTAAPSVLITTQRFLPDLEKDFPSIWKHTVLVDCAEPYYAMALASGVFAPKTLTGVHAPGERKALESDVHPSAVISSEAHIGASVKIGAGCVIESGARIGDRSVLYPGCFVGAHSEIGSDSVLFPRVVIYENCVLGSRARIHAGAVLGADGFGYAQVKSPGSQWPVRHQKIHHLGRVVCGDDVEIGANTTIDRGTVADTVIGSMVKIDNQVHIGHNCTVGEGSIICGCAGLSGGVTVGKWVMIGGLVGVANRVVIGDGAWIGGQAGLSKDVPPGSRVLGNPQRESMEFFRLHAMLNKMMSQRRAAGTERNPNHE